MGKVYKQCMHTCAHTEDMMYMTSCVCDDSCTIKLNVHMPIQGRDGERLREENQKLMEDTGSDNRNESKYVSYLSQTFSIHTAVNS